MTSNDARQYFIDKGLTYSVLTPYTIDLLVAMLNNEIMKQRKEIPDTALLYIEQPKITAKQRKTGDYSGMELKVKGTYFSHREAITFNEDGFIGFCGWASGYHKQPFIDGFLKWCDAVAAESDRLQKDGGE